jgi:hypothetical protein
VVLNRVHASMQGLAAWVRKNSGRSRMYPRSVALWGARLLFLLLAAFGAWAEERQCSVDSECGYREECRKAVSNGVVAKVKTCQCHKYVFADGYEPQCIAHNWVSHGEGVKGVGCLDAVSDSMRIVCMLWLSRGRWWRQAS